MDASPPTSALLQTQNDTIMSMPLEDHHYYPHAQTNMPSSTSATKGDDFVCNVCKRSYTRADHLARHYRSHTREKPFSCGTCGKSFGRADLLKRHTLSHNNSESQKAWKRGRRDASGQPTTRVGKACVACAASKLKCGDEKPCRRCIQNDIHCVLPTSNSHNGNHGSSQSIPLPSIGNLFDDDNNRRQSIVVNGQMDRNGNLDSDLKHSSSLTDGQFPQLNFIQPAGAFIENAVTNNLNVAPGSITSPNQDGSSSITGLDDSSLAGFLRDIMIPENANNFQDQAMGTTSHSYGLRDVFDFGIDNSLDFNDMDFDWIATFNCQPPISNPQLALDGDQPLSRGQQTPDIRNGLNLGAEAFQNSLWRWAPALRDNAYDAQESLLLSKKDAAQLDVNLFADMPEHHLEYTSRDQILAMLVGTCAPANIPRVVSSFPSTQVLSSLMHLYFKTQATSTDPWIHFPSFKPSNQRFELNAIVIAAGAVASSVPTVRKLGYAIQEAVRLAIPKAWESDNRLTRNLQLLQAYSLSLSVMVWSGNKRKMEIGESHAQPLITMMRRAGHYRKARSAPPPPRQDDADEVLEAKWHQWIEYESWKRLAFHTLIHDSQTSVAFLVPPLLSYAEVSLELPCSRMLWIAKDSSSWRDVYLNDYPSPRDNNNRLPSLLLCIHDTQPLLRVQHSTDFVMSTSIILHAIWGMIAEYLQLSHASKVQTDQRHWNGVLTSWHQELCQLLDHYHMSISEWDGVMPAETIMFQELCMMNLHVSFEELQVFAGMEGSEEAQRVYPILTTWKESRKARQAMWHAGQIVRAAMSCHPSHLKSFCAIALYHASLAFWVYGMISIGTSRSKHISRSSYETAADSDLIWLDDSETAESRRFIAINRGIPVIRDVSGGNGEQTPVFARLDNPRGVMEVIIKILNRKASGDGPVSSPLVENLSQLMKDLGRAAGIISSR